MILILEPKGLKDFGLKSLIQWICWEWVRKLGSNELDDNYGWPRWQESKDKLVLSKKIILGTIQGDQFLYISFEFDYKSSFCSYSFFLSILQSFSLRVFFLFYTIFFFHLHPLRVDQVTGVDPYPISTFLKSLKVVVGLKIIVQVSLPH